MFEYLLQATDWHARNGVFTTPHGEIETPIFMPVWTKASVKWISAQELDEMWAEIILNNTYHLYLRPGDTIIQKFGGTHNFQNYHKPILTDSGGFQVFSLGNPRQWDSLVKIDEDGVNFRSHIDGSKHFFSPEKVMDIQSNIWADIIMAFDECAPWDSTHKYATEAMQRTHRWAERSKAQWQKNNTQRIAQGLHEQALFGIVQWVVYDDLRKQSAEFISQLDTPGIAIWWLSVWESKEDMYRILDIMKEILPQEKPRYLMWVWTPEDLIEGIYRWVDMFDCVLPTRIWRHGTAFGTHGNIKVKNEQYKLSDAPLDNECQCKVCKSYSKWYLRHLILENEIQWMQLLSYHNLFFLLELARKAKAAIQKWEYTIFRENFWKSLNN